MNDRQACRMCWLQARAACGLGEPVDVIAGNRSGQQLMFANVSSSKNGYQGVRHRNTRREKLRTERQAAQATPPWRVPGQLDLFRPVALFAAARRYGLGEPASYHLPGHLDRLTIEHGRRHGWDRRNVTWRARVGMRVLLSMTGASSTPLNASDVGCLIALGLPARSVRAVLAGAGLLEEDRPGATRTWFDNRTRALPEPMASELRTWFDILHDGAATPPRTRPRSAVTIRTRLIWAQPTLEAWALAGHHSLREITRADVLAALPPGGDPRVKLGRALRSIFGTLKARRVIFANPATHLALGNFERTIPLPVNLTRPQPALASADPPSAAVAALVTYHGLRPSEVMELKLTDVRDGRLHLGDRTILMADHVKARMSDYLTYRSQRWPASLSQHYFLTCLTAPGTGPVSRHWIKDRVGMPPSAVRRGRIADETIATAGDLRRVSDFFGVTITTAEHYATVLNHPDLTTGDPGSRTQG
ncbi:MAG TPA: hypothetical protein VFV41_13005 [Streptosporangiaceae bacterium]|nr:hypothetical protein [Streptosporangiaceae bacterium]